MCLPLRAFSFKLIRSQVGLGYDHSWQKNAHWIFWHKYALNLFCFMLIQSSCSYQKKMKRSANVKDIFYQTAILFNILSHYTHCIIHLISNTWKICQWVILVDKNSKTWFSVLIMVFNTIGLIIQVIKFKTLMIITVQFIWYEISF